jgi:D-aminopeptidase
MMSQIRAGISGLLFCGVLLLSPVSAFGQPSEALTGQERITLPQWQFQPGPWNAITDVPGVRVGHVTIRRNTPHTIRTGVTAIVPHSADLAATGLWASGIMLHGNGELTGLGPLNSAGILNSPIMLTNTFAVGAVHTGVFHYFLKHYPGSIPGTTRWSGQLPVVGECYDGYFNTIEDLTAITPANSLHAIEQAKSGPVAQGQVGAGTGMRSFELHAGIGSASRRVETDGQRYTIGVLVNMNHSRFPAINPDIRSRLEAKLGTSLETLRKQDSQDQVQRNSTITQRQGSIIVVIATNLPLMPHELHEMAKRATIGIGALGSVMDTTSGDGVIAFSTANPVPVDELPAQPLNQPFIHPDKLTPVFRATVEAVTEAQINALWASHLKQSR